MRQRQQRQESLARLLSYILCRRPDEFGLVLDETGRLPVKELLWALAQEEGWGYVRRSHLEEVVNVTSPGAFELDQTHIRALQPGPANLRSQDAAWPPPALVPGHHGQISWGGGGAGPAGADRGGTGVGRRPGNGQAPGPAAGPPGGAGGHSGPKRRQKGGRIFSLRRGTLSERAHWPGIFATAAGTEKTGSQTRPRGEVGSGAAHPGFGVAGHHGPAHQTLERERPEKRPGLEGRGQRAAAAEEGINREKWKVKREG